MTARVDAEVGTIDPVQLQAIVTMLRALAEIPPSLTRPIRYGLTKGLLKHGRFFVAAARMMAEQEPERYAQLHTQLGVMEVAWLGGESLSERADEDDLRAQHALWATEHIPGLARIAANAVMRLPADHPLRDIARLRDAILRQLRHALSEPLLVKSEEREIIRRRDLALVSMGALIEHDLVVADHKASLFDAGLDLVRHGALPDRGAAFGRSVLPYAWGRAVDARKADLIAQAQKWEAIAHELLDCQMAVETDGRKRGLFNFLRLRMGGEGDPESVLRGIAADPGAAAGEFADPIDVYARMRLAEVQYREKRFAETIATLGPLMAALSERYLNAVATRDIEARGADHANACRMLAFAYAGAGRWGDAVRAIDEAKSLRFRYQMALRATPDAARVIELEAALHDRERGIVVPDDDIPPGDERGRSTIEASGPSRLLEAFREIRARLAPEYMRSPAIEEIATALEDDAALAVLGHGADGLLLAFICHADQDRPAAFDVLPPQSARRVVEALLGRASDGWFIVLNAPQMVDDPRAALSRAIDAVDAEIGVRLRRLLDERGLRRLTVVPHEILHLVPFWALPSLAGISVRMAPSAAVAMHRAPADDALAQRVLMVANPTGDLRFASLEARVVARIVAESGLTARVLSESEATQEAITREVRGAGILHFTGHGMSDAFRPLRSALEVAPDASSLDADGDDPLPRLMSSGSWTPRVDNERHLDLPQGGRLMERLLPVSKRIELRRETGTSGTLLGRYEWSNDDDAVGRRLRLSELWTVSDILRDNALRKCRMVVLSSCSTGMGGILVSGDEFAGLPAALQLAGVRTVISSLWEVDEVLATLTFSMLYREIAAGEGPVDLVAVMDRVRWRMATMSRDEAADRIDRFAGVASNAVERALLSARALKVRQGSERPFEHPFDWGAFHVIGESVVTIRQSSGDEELAIVPADDSQIEPGTNERVHDQLPKRDDDTSAASSPDAAVEASDSPDLVGAWVLLAEKSGKPVLMQGAARELVKRANVRRIAGDLPGALADAERAIAFAPYNAPAHATIGRVLSDQGRHGEAIEAYSCAIAIDDTDADSYAARASAFISQERHTEAIADLCSAIARDEDSLHVWYVRGMLRQQLGDHQAAVDDLSRVIERRPEDADAYEGRADSLEELGDRQRAIDDLSAAIVLRPREARPLHQRGYLKAALGLHEAATADYDEALRLDDRHGPAYFNRACATSMRCRGTSAWRDFSVRRAALRSIVADLTRAFDLDASIREHARTDAELAWAREHSRTARRMLR